MSEWAYRECPKCGRRTHINMYCSKEGCDGDPWGIEKDTLVEIAMVEQDRDKYLMWVEQCNDKLQRLLKKLPKGHEKAKLFKG